MNNQFFKTTPTKDKLNRQKSLIVGFGAMMALTLFPVPTLAQSVKYKSTTSTTDTSPPPIVLTIYDYGETIRVTQGTRIFVKLDEDRTSGYRWFLGKLDDKVLTSDGVDFNSNYSPTGLQVTGTNVFRFKAKAPGTGKIVLNLKRYRSSYGSPTKSFIVNVVIN